MPYRKRPPLNYTTPKFTTHLPHWQYDPDTDAWTERGTVCGQVYTPLRGQDDRNGGTLYFEYPKENDVLRDTFDYDADGKADVLILGYPTNNPRINGYKVRDISPRWLKFVNEHLHATLQKLTPSELADVMGNHVPPPPFVDYFCTVEFHTETGQVQLPVAANWAQAEAEFLQTHSGLVRKTISFWAERPDAFPVAPAPELFDPVAPVLKTRIKKKKKRIGRYRIEGVYEYGPKKVTDGEPFVGNEPKYGNFTGSLLRLPIT